MVLGLQRYGSNARAAKSKLFVISNFKYRKVASSNTSRLEAHIGFFRLLMKGIFGPYVL